MHFPTVRNVINLEPWFEGSRRRFLFFVSWFGGSVAGSCFSSLLSVFVCLFVAAFCNCLCYMTVDFYSFGVF